jgi:hypothetical protein
MHSKGARASAASAPMRPRWSTAPQALWRRPPAPAAKRFDIEADEAFYCAFCKQQRVRQKKLRCVGCWQVRWVLAGALGAGGCVGCWQVRWVLAGALGAASNVAPPTPPPPHPRPEIPPARPHGQRGVARRPQRARV